MRRFWLFLVVILVSSVAAASSKVQADSWQTGTLTDSQESWHQRTVGTLNNGNGMLIGREYPIVRYTIDSPTYIYEVDLTLRHRHDKQPSLTVNGPIKFAVVKSDFYIQDENGKELKLTLTKKTLKQSNSEPPKSPN